MSQLSVLKPKTVFQKNNTGLTAGKKNSVPASILLNLEIDARLLSQYMPACAVINANMDILQLRGSASLFLSQPQGKAGLNILRMAKSEFVSDLQAAIRKAFKTKKAVRKSGMEIGNGNTYRLFSIEVSPLKTGQDELLLVVFTPEIAPEQQEKGIRGGKSAALQNRKVKKLIDELNTIRTEMQSLLEFREKANEQLQAAKEEIEASNEELISTNQELQTRNDLLMESYHYSEAIFATIHEPMLILHKNLTVKFASRSYYKKFKTTKEKTENFSLFELGNGQWDIPKLRELLKTVLSKNSNFENLEVTHLPAGKSERVMLLNASRIIQKTHHEKLILLAIRDITERAILQRKEDRKNRENIRFHEEKKLVLENAIKGRTKELVQKNLELNSANIELAFQNHEKEKRAEELGMANLELAFQNDEKEKRAIELSIANQDLTSFTYISSHDLQEPLRKIQSFADRILHEEEQHLSEKGKGYFNRMMETAKRMQQLIDDLLVYSRTKSGERIFEVTKMSVLLNDVCRDFENTILLQKAVIENQTDFKVKVIPFQFRQLLHNLISNSLKFAKPGEAPHIAITSRIVPAGEPGSVPLFLKKEHCQITYTDNGIGFDQQYKDRIFEVFQRLHGMGEFPGTGIGLAICKRVVENHNGVITATGTPGQGARFDIYIPVE